MASWNSGYVTDLGYTHGFYRELVPGIQAFAALSAGQSTAVDLASPMAYCELGCGQGFSANVIAASNPTIEVHATDFNPSHIAGARKLAVEGGLDNAHFYDDSFAEFDARNDLPDFDIIALHGIYSWVTEERRREIIHFIDRRLKPGGIVYISYNALPGWSASAPLRHLMYLHGKSTGGPTGARLQPAFDFVERVEKAKARYFMIPGLKERFEKLKSETPNYVAHEYFNDAWTLFYHSDVSEELQQARLTFSCSAHLLDHVDAINLDDEQQLILKEIPDIAFRETLRDYMVNQQFRRDIFLRGPLPLSVSEAREAMLDQRFALTSLPAEVSLKVKGGRGEAALQQEIYKPILQAFGKAEGRILTPREMLEMPILSAMPWARLKQALVILVGANHLQPCPPRRAGVVRSPERFNTAVMRHTAHGSGLSSLASTITGGGVMVGRFEQLFMLADRQGSKNHAEFAWQALHEAGQRLAKDGKVLQSPTENIAELEVRLEDFRSKRLPLLKQLGIT